MHVGDFVDAGTDQLRVDGGHQRSDSSSRPASASPRPCVASRNKLDEFVGGKRRARAGVLDEEAKLPQILFAATQTHRCRKRHRDQTCVLAGEEQDDELGARLGNQCNPVATRDVDQSEKTPGRVHRLRAQLPIAQLTYDFATAVEERHAMTASCGVVQRFVQR